MEMNRHISEAHNNEYNPLYYSVDSTKAALPCLFNYNSDVEVSEYIPSEASKYLQSIYEKLNKPM